MFQELQFCFSFIGMRKESAFVTARVLSRRIPDKNLIEGTEKRCNAALTSSSDPNVVDRVALHVLGEMFSLDDRLLGINQPSITFLSSGHFGDLAVVNSPEQFVVQC